MNTRGSGGGGAGTAGVAPAADPGEALGIAAHELRQPASVIYGLATTLVHQRAALSDEQLDEVLRRLHRQAERLVGVLDETLNLDRIRRATTAPVRSPVELATAIREALAVAAPPAGSRVGVAVPEGLAVLATPEGLERILVNLLANAYRYGGPCIRIEAELAPGGARVCVADDGPGVPEDLVAHLFEPFRAQPGGHGLGLSIVLALAESFGGWVRYRPGNPGAAFEVTLRTEEEPGRFAAPDLRSPAPTDEPATVLVVDDEADIRWLLRFALESAGYRVVEAAHGQEALDSVRDQPPALVVSDLMMPVMDGNELSRRLRAQPGGAELPILVLSANPDLARDADRVMRKPCNIGELTRAVGDLLHAGRNGGVR